jgi:hypothetical protein
MRQMRQMQYFHIQFLVVVEDYRASESKARRDRSNANCGIVKAELVPPLASSTDCITSAFFFSVTFCRREVTWRLSDAMHFFWNVNIEKMKTIRSKQFAPLMFRAQNGVSKYWFSPIPNLNFCPRV